MFGTFHGSTFAQPDVRSIQPLPMVYEDIPAKPASWEYHLLTIDAQREALPDVATLNQLGSEGWLLVGVLDQRMRNEGSLFHYYFVRQRKD